MKKIKLYLYAQAETMPELMSSVNHNIEEGYQPFGSLIVGKINDREMFIQIMVAYEEDANK